MSVSVAIPCYNGADYIAQTIRSVLAQTQPPDQVLVIDDGSTDESAAIIRRYPVELVSHARNRGLSAARNTAIAHAKGDVLVVVDVDAFADADLLQVLLSGYTDNPRMAGVGGQGIESNIHSLADRWRRVHASQSHGRRAKDVPFLYGLCMSFRVSVLRQIGGFRERFRTNAEDVDMGLRLTAAGYTLRYLPAARVFHQRRDDIASLKRTMARWYTAAYVAKRVNHAHAWTLFAGTLRRLVMDPLKDIFVVRDFALVPLSVAIGWIKLQALWKAYRAYKGEA